MPDGVNILNLNIPANPDSDEIIQANFADKMFSTEIEKELIHMNIHIIGL